MSRRPRPVPIRGDVLVAQVAELMGLSLADFVAFLPELVQRGFPQPDATTGRYCVEAIDRWRLRRHATLFPSLTAASAATDAQAVFDDRRRAVFGRG